MWYDKSLEVSQEKAKNSNNEFTIFDMYIEKDLNTLLENVNSRKAENEAQTNTLHKWLSRHRSNVRHHFLRKQFNALPVFIFLPFVVGCSDFFLKKATLQNGEPLFGKTLPLFRDFRPQVNFETREYIAKFNDLSNLQNKRFDSLQKSNDISFGIPSFLGTIKKRHLSTPLQKNSTPTPLYTLSSGTSSQNQLFDQLPSYLKGYFPANSKENPELILLPTLSRLENRKKVKQSVLNTQATTPSTLCEKRGPDLFFTPPLFFNKTFSNIFFSHHDLQKNNLILVVPTNVQRSSKKRDLFGDRQKNKEVPVSFAKLPKKVSHHVFLDKEVNEFLATKQLQNSFYVKNQFFRHKHDI